MIFVAEMHKKRKIYIFNKYMNKCVSFITQIMAEGNSILKIHPEERNVKLKYKCVAFV